MAAPDVYSTGPTSKANGEYLAFQPGAGYEINIYNIHSAGAFELYHYDGTNEILVASCSGADSIMGLELPCTNTSYYRVKNVSGGACLMSASGRYSK